MLWTWNIRRYHLLTIQCSNPHLPIMKLYLYLRLMLPLVSSHVSPHPPPGWLPRRRAGCFSSLTWPRLSPGLTADCRWLKLLGLPGSVDWSERARQSGTNQSTWMVLAWRSASINQNIAVREFRCWLLIILLDFVSVKVRSSKALYYSSGEMWLWDSDLLETIWSKLKVVPMSSSAIISIFSDFS